MARAGSDSNAECRVHIAKSFRPYFFNYSGASSGALEFLLAVLIDEMAMATSSLS
jgi:hypothetical protein